MPTGDLARDEARRIALAAQGFDRPRPRGRVGAPALRRTIRQLGLLQMDFVNVLVPAHYVVPFSRLGPYDRALLGGTPDDVPELMKERSPIEYVDRVRAPLLLLAGEHDSRCPLPQVLNYVDRLKARGHPYELYLFGTGHSSFDVDERIRQLGVVLDYLSKTVPGVRRLAGVREVEVQPELV